MVLKVRLPCELRSCGTLFVAYICGLHRDGSSQLGEVGEASPHTFIQPQSDIAFVYVCTHRYHAVSLAVLTRCAYPGAHPAGLIRGSRSGLASS